MGHDTDFEGSVTVEPPLNAAEVAWLREFAQSRRCRRTGGPYDTSDPDRVPPHYNDGYNDYAEGQPNLWCQWEPSEHGAHISWNGAENFRDGDAWMRYLVDHFLRPGAVAADPALPNRPPAFDRFTFDHQVNGRIEARDGDGEQWTLVVENNEVSTAGPVSFEEALEAVAAVERYRRVEATLRALCVPSDQFNANDPDSVEGSAAYVRLINNDPMDFDVHATPVLAVTVADVLRILDETR
jgi:hypothetical protein